MTLNTTTPPESTATPSTIKAFVYGTGWRVLLGGLVSIAGASLLVIAAVFWFNENEPYNPLRLIRQVSGCCLLPAFVAWALRRIFTATLQVTGDFLVVQQRHQRTEIPISNITGIAPWSLPLPGTGAQLHLQSAQHWKDGFEIDDPGQLANFLAEAGAPAELRDITEQPSALYAKARKQSRLRALPRIMFKFPLYALVPTVPLFRVHQVISYGGAFGEYHQYGLQAYLAGLAVYWATLTIYLMLFAAVLRVCVEFASIAATIWFPNHAVAARQNLDRTSGLLYYGGIPIAVLLRFMPW